MISGSYGYPFLLVFLLRHRQLLEFGADNQGIEGTDECHLLVDLQPRGSIPGGALTENVTFSSQARVSLEAGSIRLGGKMKPQVSFAFLARNK